MLPTSVEKMLESMMKQMLNPQQKAASVSCCNCFKEKKKESHRSSNTSCKCRSAPKKQKKHHRKRNKSCLKTIVCLTKIAKHGAGECEGCSCHPCCGNMGHDVDSTSDERFCSKCGQLLPGIIPADRPLNQPDLQCLEQLQRCQQESKNMAVQANVDRKEPLSVRIKVCPCPNVNPRNQDHKLHHSVSMPEISSTDPRLVDGASSGNLVISRGPHARFTDGFNEESLQSQLPTKGINETTPEWPVDAASIKKLALKLAKARLVEEAACWEREYARRYLRQEVMYEQDEQPTDEPSGVDRRKSAKTNGFEKSQGQTAPNAPEFKTGIQAFPNYKQTPEAALCNEYGTTDFGGLYTPRQSTGGGCCDGTDVYCYSPENGPSLFSDDCEHACTCGDTDQFQPYQFPGPYSGNQYQNIPYQQKFGSQQDRSTHDPYNLSYGSLGNRPRSPCQLIKTR